MNAMLILAVTAITAVGVTLVVVSVVVTNPETKDPECMGTILTGGVTTGPATTLNVAVPWNTPVTIACPTATSGHLTTTAMCNANADGTFTLTDTGQHCNSVRWCPATLDISKTTHSVATVTCPANSIEGFTCAPVCSQGYATTIPAICGGAVWSTPVGVCAPKLCPITAAPTNGSLTGGFNDVDREPLDTRAFVCNQGYAVSGTATSTCNGNAGPSTWSAPDATCTVGTCGTPTLTHARVDTTTLGAGQTTITNGATMTFVCEDGFDAPYSVDTAWTCISGAWTAPITNVDTQLPPEGYKCTGVGP